METEKNNDLFDEKSESHAEKLQSNLSETEIIEKRKEKIIIYLKQNATWIFYILLGLVVYLSIFIRTRNMTINPATGKPKLWDIATNSWTLGPDLDPFLFLRWAEYIVEHGKLFAMDAMRYVPIGYNTAGEMSFLSYTIAWFYKFMAIFSEKITLTYAAIILPVVMFALTLIVFFFLVRKIFFECFEDKRLPNLIALLSCFFLTVLPPLLPRTIAGIPEKESMGFLFIFLSFYFFICFFKSDNYKKIAIYSVLTGLSTVILGLVWGGVSFVFIVTGFSLFVFYFIGQINNKKFFGIFLFTLIFTFFLILLSTRYSIRGFVASMSMIPLNVTLISSAFNLFLYPKIKKIKVMNSIIEKYKIPKEIVSLVLSLLILLVLSLIFISPQFITNQIKTIYNSFVRPFNTTRFLVTVAENRQPYFIEWASNFSPMIKNFAVFFWISITGSVLLFYNLIKKFELKEKSALIFSYALLLFCLILSRYSSGSKFNGENNISLFVYFGSIILFSTLCLYIWSQYYKKNKLDTLEFDFSIVFMIVFTVIMLLAARGAVRLIMALTPIISIFSSYFLIFCFNESRKKDRDELMRAIVWILTLSCLAIFIYSGYFFYNVSIQQAESYYPSQYQYQWQKAMSWVRENTPENAVFGHWWDYGYWLQSIGKRATVLDGGNAIAYWNHFMGGDVLTATNDSNALEFLYTHKTTHYLIDSTEIGKYSAYSSIGSDKNYDKLSYFPTIIMDEKNTKETLEGIIYYYSAGFGLDEDIVLDENGTKIIFPKETSGIAMIMVRENNLKEFMQPEAILVKNPGLQRNAPLRYLYYNGEMKDFGSGLDAGIFLMDYINIGSNGVNNAEKSAGFYLSKRTVHSFVTRKYLFGEEGNFKLVHTEPNFLITELRNNRINVSDFVFFQGQFLGPIKIWEIQYPKDIKENPDYLKTEYPEEILWSN